MRQIYSNARMVPIWLVEEDDLTIMALSMIKKISQLDFAAQNYQNRAGDIYDPRRNARSGTSHHFLPRSGKLCLSFLNVDGFKGHG